MRVSESAVYTKLILVDSLELDELEEGRVLRILMCFKCELNLLNLLRSL